MTNKEQEIIDILSGRIYVMVSMKSVFHPEAKLYENVTYEIKGISERMTKEEITSKYTCFDWMNYPAHYKKTDIRINFWEGGGLIYCPYIPFIMLHPTTTHYYKTRKTP